MDSVTQIVLGAAVGQAVLGSKVGNKALLYGAVAGTIPDLDVISRLDDILVNKFNLNVILIRLGKVKRYYWPILTSSGTNLK